MICSILFIQFEYFNEENFGRKFGVVFSNIN